MNLLQVALQVAQVQELKHLDFHHKRRKVEHLQNKSFKD
jgi:hypothetical protein